MRQIDNTTRLLRFSFNSKVINLFFYELIFIRRIYVVVMYFGNILCIVHIFNARYSNSRRYH